MSWNQMWKNTYLRFWRKWSNRIWHWGKRSLNFTSNLSAAGLINCSDRKWDALLIWVSWKSPLISMESGVSIGSHVREEALHPQDLTLQTQYQVCGTDFRSICRICVYMCVHNFCLLATKWPFLRDTIIVYKITRSILEMMSFLYFVPPLKERNCMYLWNVFIYIILTSISFCCAATFHRCNK